MNSFKIDHFELSENSQTFIIAELSANHNHKFDLAIETIKAAKEAGADAIKFQTYTADTITIDCDNDYFQIKHGTLWDGQTLYNLYKQAYTPWDWQPKLKKYAQDIGLICFSSPFDFSAVDFLEEMNIPAYKIASLEIVDIPLIAYIASKGKPIILSSGIATLKDIEEAIAACKKAGNYNIALLKCTSSYPAPYEDANLLTIANMRETFNIVPGLSDHTIGSAVAIAAVALGAKIIEKHFILDRSLGGPDSAFSMEPHEFKEMVDSIRIVEKSIGTISYDLSPQVLKSREHCRSLFITEKVKAGEIFTKENVRSIRPGYGLQPKYLDSVLGKKARILLEKGTPLSWNYIA